MATRPWRNAPAPLLINLLPQLPTACVPGEVIGHPEVAVRKGWHKARRPAPGRSQPWAVRPTADQAGQAGSRGGSAGRWVSGYTRPRAQVQILGDPEGPAQRSRRTQPRSTQGVQTGFRETTGETAGTPRPALGPLSPGAASGPSCARSEVARAGRAA